jgi:hypothetical protein
MNALYPSPKGNAMFPDVIRKVAGLLILITSFSVTVNAQQDINTTEMVFKNPVLESGVAGANGAVYRFPSVRTGVDGLVTITGRSSSKVELENIDVSSTGIDNAFQPLVEYDDEDANAAEWWMEFQVSYVLSSTTIPYVVNGFKVTALNLQGDGNRLSEYASFYRQFLFTTASLTYLNISSVSDNVLGIPTKGTKFAGPVRTFPGGIDTSNTAIMVTNTYTNTGSYVMRAGASYTGKSYETSRMYSFWFKGFSYKASQESTLPVTLINWNATCSGSSVNLKWTTTVEKNASHFIIERSFDGSEYSDDAMIVAVGNSDITNNYAYTDKIPAGNSGIIYYRLKMVDMDGGGKVSEVRIVRIGKSNTEQVKVAAYPNPVISDLRVTVPQSWQDKTVTYQLVSAQGQIIKSYTVQRAGQTEIISMSGVPAGMYVISIKNGDAISTQTIVKATY